MKYWLPIIFIVMSGFVTACVSSPFELTSTALPEATLTPKRIFAHPICEIEPQMYKEEVPVPDDRIRVWIDMGTDVPENTLAAFANGEEIYRCNNIRIDQIIAAGHVFVLDVQAGPLQIRFVNVTTGAEEVVELMVEQELFVLGRSYVDEANNGK